MVDLGHVRAFSILAEELHFGRAARRLHITQSPLTRQIQLLEAELSTDLFSRANRAVRLTPAGHAFLPEARALLQMAEAAAQAARQAGSGHTGKATIGFTGACWYGFLPDLVARARLELPNVALTLREMTTELQMEALSRGQLDLGFGRPLPAKAGLETVCVLREGLAAALPAGHPLTRKRRVLPRQVAREPFIMYSPEGWYMRNLLNSAFAAAGVQPDVVQELSQAQAILSLVSAGMGIAIVPEQAGNACFDNVVFRPAQLGGNQVAELHAIWRRDDGNPVIAPLRELAMKSGLGAGHP